MPYTSSSHKSGGRPAEEDGRFAGKELHGQIVKCSLITAAWSWCVARLSLRDEYNKSEIKNMVRAKKAGSVLKRRHPNEQIQDNETIPRLVFVFYNNDSRTRFASIRSLRPRPINYEETK